jgi:DNA-binding GntR family transcriptional regulator
MTTLATETLKEGIIEGRFQPDEMLVPMNLEKRFGLGKMAFREAILELVGVGLVKSVSNKGNFVAPPPAVDEIREIFEVRLLIERKVAIKGAANISAEDLARMELLHDQMQKKSITPRDFFFLNKEFHLVLYRASGWDYLCHLINQLIEYVFMFRFRLGIQKKGARSGFTYEHGLILEAIRGGKTQKVGDLIVRNIRSKFTNIKETIEGKK